MGENKNYTVYMHIFPNKKVYIGITSQKVEHRWRNGTKYGNNQYMENAIKKYGWENIEHKILFVNLSKIEAENKEIELIRVYKSNIRKYGYNILNGGNVSKGMTLKARKKMSQKRKGKHYSIKTEFKKGHKPWTTGKKMSDEFKEKLSRGHLGQVPWNRKKIICLETNTIYSSMGEAAKQLNVNKVGISKVCRKIMNQTSGYHFEYYSNN